MASECARADVAERRRLWIDQRQPRMRRQPGRLVFIDETGVRTAAGVLAGSNLTLDRAVRNLVAFTGCSPAEAIMTVTRNPANVLGIDDRGTISVGARADIVVLDQSLRVVQTFIGGRLAWRS